ncbi:MAG: YceI family protein [Rhodococcus sp. (in: high G+C Gram-positive bacteria)]|uniref:YceI family protein n=1 Tax=Rhodococcus sp. TaxID=1831 RepID=UPI003BB4BA49
MRKIWWSLAAIVVVALLGFFVAPWVYGTFIAEDDAPAASVSTSGAQAATGDLTGSWTIASGSEVNRTAAGYTVHEILRGADVTVVGSTDQVSGTATIEGDSLAAAEVTVQVAGITTDSSQRDGQFRGRVMAADTYPTAIFVLAGPVDLSAVPADGTTTTLPVTGTLTLRDRSLPVTVDVEVLRSGTDLVASGSVPVIWSDFGIEAPSLGFVTVDDRGSVDFLVSFAKN